ncbi:unnamed protein product (mitochondrion) [Plasmodiophora brassicae]|uniref:Uncharacterized protein n=1 Tax=Plasmodiophora brassicae TaxID=37360 RepID=A0A3P3YH92_PLABS|nr:unnamed protein product [Plasmodiophora brassicae]
MPREGSEGTNHTWSQEEIRILYNCAKAGQRPEEIARQSLRSLTPKQISNKLYSLKKSTQGLTLPIPSERRRASAQDGAKQAGRRRPDQTATQTVAMADAYAKDPVKDGDAGDDNDPEEGNTDDSGDKQKEQAMANFETLVDLEMIAVKQMPDAVHMFVRTLPGYSIGIEVEQDCARLLYKPYRYGEDLWTVSGLTLSEAMDLFEAQGPDYTPFEAIHHQCATGRDFASC